jgi:hypothetical protein
MKPLPVIEKIKNLLQVALNVQIRWTTNAVFMPSRSGTFFSDIVP